MTRMEEWSALQQTLEQTPPELEDTVARAKKRAQKRIWAKRLFGMPMAGAAALLAGFVLLVNLSTPFAYACADIPGLKPLVQAVAMNPSLRETLTHNYVQEVLATQQAGEFTVTVKWIFSTISTAPKTHIKPFIPTVILQAKISKGCRPFSLTTQY